MRALLLHIVRLRFTSTRQERGIWRLPLEHLRDFTSFRE